MRMRNKLAANGDAIRTIRQLKGWDLRTFAKNAGISESHLGNVENGRRDLSPANLLHVASVLDVPLGAISKTVNQPVGPAPAKVEPQAAVA